MARLSKIILDNIVRGRGSRNDVKRVFNDKKQFKTNSQTAKKLEEIQ